MNARGMHGDPQRTTTPQPRMKDRRLSSRRPARHLARKRTEVAHRTPTPQTAGRNRPSTTSLRAGNRWSAPQPSAGTPAEGSNLRNPRVVTLQSGTDAEALACPQFSGSGRVAASDEDRTRAKLTADTAHSPDDRAIRTTATTTAIGGAPRACPPPRPAMWPMGPAGVGTWRTGQSTGTGPLR
jgi:hypothetical protein